MEILAKYRHGSEDSTDVDVHYVVDALPDPAECKRFCSEDPAENRNLIMIRDGVVTNVYKGTPDEVNNALLRTYPLHDQTSPLLVERPVPRVRPLKYVRAVRIILSHFSRSQYRKEVKEALVGGSWHQRVSVLNTLDLTQIDFDTLNKHMTGADVRKVVAYQIGQTLALTPRNNPAELYTKREIALEFPCLAPYLQREPSPVDNLAAMLHMFCGAMWAVAGESTDGDTVATFEDNGSRYYVNLKTEKIERTLTLV